MAQEAQAAVAADSFVMGTDLFYALLAMNVILLFLVFYQVNVLRSLIGMIKGEEEETETVMDAWAASLTDAVPLEKEEEIMFEHEHDGIRELDNNLPPWWLWGFYFTIVFGPIYIAYYHFMGGPSSHQEWVTEMEKGEEAKAAYLAGLDNLIDENNVELVMDEASLAEGAKIWTDNCAACHGANGEGGVGPNMTDAYWIHGGGVKNVFKTIKYGVPTKGMIPWEAQLSPGQMRSVASYIIAMEGTNPEGAKEPQGEIWKEDTAAPAAEAATDSSATTEAMPENPEEPEKGEDKTEE
jgi:cytochrome c oxidase cbb3-type subunit 3